MKAPIQEGNAMSIMVNHAPFRVPPKLHGLTPSFCGKGAIHSGNGTDPHPKYKACNHIKEHSGIANDSRFLLKGDKLIFEKYDRYGKVVLRIPDDHKPFTKNV
jgi:hypothetical protein